ncbi:MAG: AbrB family transcriptional regulator [Gemmatimonadetes bacterium]|nr:AbrB family transcriptional regulator [Gemmatimonadota bacterium]
MWITVAAGLAGGLVGMWLRLPAGALVGSMVAVGAVSLTVHAAPIPPLFGDMAKILIGTMVGSTITPEILQNLRGLALPAVVVVVLMIVAGLLGGWALSHFTGVDIATALFATAPGGSAEMTAAAQGLKADASLVASLQAVRIVVVILGVPVLLRWWLKP